MGSLYGQRGTPVWGQGFLSVAQGPLPQRRARVTLEILLTIKFLFLKPHLCQVVKFLERKMDMVMQNWLSSRTGIIGLPHSVWFCRRSQLGIGRGLVPAQSPTRPTQNAFPQAVPLEADPTPPRMSAPRAPDNPRSCGLPSAQPAPTRPRRWWPSLPSPAQTKLAGTDSPSHSPPLYGG